jgi:dipeptidyl aminopeptidase/acylaminoacyl peptidase
MSRDGTDVRALTHEASNSEPTFSPDGRKLAFVRDFTIRTMDPDGSEVSGPLQRGLAPVWGAGTRVDQPLISGPRSATATVTRSGRVRLRGSSVACPGLGGDCRVTVKLTRERHGRATVVARGALLAQADSVDRLAARLSARGRRALARRRAVSAVLQVVVNRGGRRTQLFRLRLVRRNH